MSKIILQFEFDYYEDSNELKIILRSREYHSALHEIDENLRSKLKYSEDEWLENEKCSDYLESLREIIWESGVFRDE